MSASGGGTIRAFLLQRAAESVDTSGVDAARPHGRTLVITTAVVLALCLAIRCAVLVTLYDGDMELFVYMGKLAGQGGRIGIELIDNKLPTVSLVMWPLHAVLGVWWPGYAWVGVGGAIVAVAAIARAAAAVNRSSLWPTAAMTAAWMSFPLAVFSAFKLEHLTVTASALAAWAFVRCWRSQRGASAVLVGLSAGIGAMAKPNALAVLVAAVAAVVTWQAWPWRTRVRLVACMAVGCAVPVAGALVYLVQSGAVDALPDVYRQIRSYNQNSVWQPERVIAKAMTVAFLIALPLLMRWFAERRRREPLAAGAGVVVRFAVGWLALEVAGIALQGRMYGYHFLPLTAPAALLFGLIPRRALAVTVIGSTTPVLITSVFWAWSATLATPTPTDRLAAIDYVKSHAAAGDAVWMDEYARLLVESDLLPGSRVPLTFIFSNDDAAPDRFGTMIVDDLLTRRPRWIVLPTDALALADRLRVQRIEYSERPARGEAMVRAWRRIDDAVRGGYREVKTFGDHRVFQRADVGGDQPGVSARAEIPGDG